MKISLGSIARLGKGIVREQARGIVFDEAEKLKADLKDARVDPSIVVDSLAARIWRRLDKAL